LIMAIKTGELVSMPALRIDAEKVRDRKSVV
jgi:hypothetical protein